MAKGEKPANEMGAVDSPRPSRLIIAEPTSRSDLWPARGPWSAHVDRAFIRAYIDYWQPVRCAMEFEWDDVKAASNLIDHPGVSFADAQRVFDDPNRLEFFQRREGEDRWIVVGASGAKLLAVIYTERGPKVRIISARKATKDEKKAYSRR
jgi:uncharacterized protein